MLISLNIIAMSQYGSLRRDVTPVTQVTGLTSTFFVLMSLNILSMSQYVSICRNTSPHISASSFLGLMSPNIIPLS